MNSKTIDELNEKYKKGIVTEQFLAKRLVWEVQQNG